MNDFDGALIDMDAELLNTFGQKVIYNDASAIDVVIDLNVEQFGAFDTKGPARRHEISFLTAQVKDPKRGYKIEADSGIFFLDGLISNDGHISRWHINES